MGLKARCTVLAVTVLLLGAAGASQAGDRLGQGALRDQAMGGGRHHGSRFEGRGRVPDGIGSWWAPSEPALPDYAPSLVIVQPPPVFFPQPPPPLAQPSYYWYACGPEGQEVSAHEQQPSAYCVGGLSPTLHGVPRPGQSVEQFQADDAACRRSASTQAATLPGVTASRGSPGSEVVGASRLASGTMQERYDFAYQQCLYVKRDVPVARAGPPSAPPPH
ncbi:MAG TPA: hypothetical protein VN203_06705 [Candidatus Acidoferrum sp.]|nr:hypothetical protein [Candidatus Acidoferrum sp.]